MIDTEKRDRLLAGFRSRKHVRATEVNQADGTVRILVVSELSGTESTLTVPADGLVHWLDNNLIQVALPDLTHDERELLLTGYTAEDWEQMFPDDEEDEEL